MSTGALLHCPTSVKSSFLPLLFLLRIVCCIVIILRCNYLATICLNHLQPISFPSKSKLHKVVGGRRFLNALLDFNFHCQFIVFFFWKKMEFESREKYFGKRFMMKYLSLWVNFPLHAHKFQSISISRSEEFHHVTPFNVRLLGQQLAFYLSETLVAWWT